MRQRCCELAPTHGDRWSADELARVCRTCKHKFGIHASGHPHSCLQGACRCKGFTEVSKIEPDFKEFPVRLSQEQVTKLAKGEQIRMQNPWTEDPLVLQGALTSPQEPDYFLEAVDAQAERLDLYERALNLALEAAEAGIGKGLTPLEALRKIQNYVRETLEQNNGLREKEWTGFL